MEKIPFLLIGLVAGVVLDRVVQANQSDPFSGVDRNSLDWADDYPSTPNPKLKPWEGSASEWTRVYGDDDKYNNCWFLLRHAGPVWCERASGSRSIPRPSI
jgi:hypothetical protein